MTAVTNFRVDSFIIGLAIKAPVRVATNVAITLSGLQTVNGHLTGVNDRVLVKDQADPIDNGIYTAQTSAWQRDGDFDGNRDIVGGTIVPAYRVSDGVIVLYNVDGEPESIEVGVDAINFSQYWDGSAAGLTEINNLITYVEADGTPQVIDPSLSEINVQNGDYTLLIADKGKTISKESGGAGETFTIPANSSVAFKLGTFVGFNNDGGGDLTIAITDDTLIWADDNSTGSRTIADGGYAVAQKVTVTTWKIAGKQLT